MVTLFIGGQFGDEGKGKIIDWFCANKDKDVDIVARFQGGANAGHTVFHNGKLFVLHQIPSGILSPQITCIMGNGMVINLPLLMTEIEDLKKAGISIKNRLFISSQAHLTLPHHLLLEKLSEERKSGKIGTTLKGIGPTYTDKYARTGILAGYLLYPQLFKEKLAAVLEEKNRILRDIYGFSKTELLNSKKIAQEYLEMARPIIPFITDTVTYLNKAIKKGKNVLIEGAQGTFIDIDQGTYPYVTSSSTTAAGACTGLGISPKVIDKIFLVVKAYITRVGNGPLVTRMLPKVEEEIRKWGKEYGATTGRPRNCGWFDGVLLKRAVMINHPDYLILTKLDVLNRLSEIGEKPKIVTHYSLDRKMINAFSFPLVVEDLTRCEIGLVKEFENWCTLGNDFDEFPLSAQGYIRFIRDLAGVDIALISTGSETEAMIERICF